MYKRNLIVSVLAIIMTGILLNGCGKNNKDVSELKKPIESVETQKVTSEADKEKFKDQTIKNLKDAVTGEMTASAKYAAYSKKAKEEGFLKIAKLFEATSNSEKIHANNHIAVLEQLGVKVEDVQPKFEVKSTKENLNDAISGETYEMTTMYPSFIKTSDEGKMNLATISFNYAYKTEMRHKVMYETALNNLNNNKENTMPSEYYVCPTCGNTYDTQVPGRCGISMTAKDRFIKI
jgi:rubrerythrin